MEYKEFLEWKIKRNIESGIDVDEILLNKYLFPFLAAVNLSSHFLQYAMYSPSGISPADSL